MVLTCPRCQHQNNSPARLAVVEYICEHCHHLIRVAENKDLGEITSVRFPVVLLPGQQGFLDDKTLTVTAVVVRKAGRSIFWREYYCLDEKGEQVFLSESDGHWVLLFPQKEALTDHGHFASFKNKNYRLYETTDSIIAQAAGFFDDHLRLRQATYREYVNGTELISCEEHATTEFFWGYHVPRKKIQRAFQLQNMPPKIGIGIVQPAPIDGYHASTIFGLAALLISLFQLYTLLSRQNVVVFQEEIAFEKVHNKSYLSSSFSLHGAAAPMEVQLFADISNTWANIELHLVNEKTNEIIYTSQDLEEYHGVEDGETWSEGSRKVNLNLCGIPQGTYHWEITAQKEFYEHTATGNAMEVQTWTNADGSKIYRRLEGNWAEVKNTYTDSLTTYALPDLYTGYPNVAKEIDSTYRLAQKNPSLMDPLPDFTGQAPHFSIIAEWKPVSFWNYGIAMLLLCICTVGAYAWEHSHKREKWKNSSNSPYTYE